MIKRGEPPHWTDPFVSLDTLSGNKEDFLLRTKISQSSSEYGATFTEMPS